MDARVFFCLFDSPLFGWIDKYVLFGMKDAMSFVRYMLVCVRV